MEYEQIAQALEDWIAERTFPEESLGNELLSQAAEIVRAFAVLEELAKRGRLIVYYPDEDDNHRYQRIGPDFQKVITESKEDDD